MNHRPFEDWLLEDRPLSGREQRELQVHLHSCPSCAAIAESNLALHSAHLTPAPTGFADRFNQRLARWRRRQRWYQVLGTLVLVIGGLTVLYTVAGTVVRQALRSPADWITAATVYLVFAVESLQVLNEVGRIVVRDLRGFVSPLSWIVVSLGGVGLALAWAVSVRRLVRARQGV